MSTKTLTEEALENIGSALDKIGGALEDLGATFEALITVGLPPVPHAHTWVFLRQDLYAHAISREEILEKIPHGGKDLTGYVDRYQEASDVYYCSGCAEMRRIVYERYVINPFSDTGRPHIVFWQKEIPAL